MSKAAYKRKSLFWTYGSRCLGSIMAGTAGGRHDSWTTAENSYLIYYWKCDMTFEISISAPSGIFPSARPHLLNLPKQAHQLGNPFQMSHNVGDISFKLRYLPQFSVDEILDGWIMAILVTVTILWRETMAMATLIKESISFELAYRFRGFSPLLA